MINITSSLLTASEHIAHSFALQLFTFSSTLLLIGICAKVWFHAFKLAWLDTITLDKVEYEHPYIPNFSIIRRVSVSATVLLIASAFLLTQYEPFTGTYEFLYVVGSFAIVTTIALLSELHWQQYKEYSFAILAASSLAFVVFVLRLFIESQEVAPSLFFAGGLLISIVVSLQLLRNSNKKSINITFLGTMVFWFSLHLLSQMG
jgi:hypothetical protein